MSVDTTIDSRVESLLNKGENLEILEDYILGYLSSSHYGDGFHRLLLNLDSESFRIEHTNNQSAFSALPHCVVLVDEFSSLDQRPFQRPDLHRDNMDNFGAIEMKEALCDEVFTLLR